MRIKVKQTYLVNGSVESYLEIPDEELRKLVTELGRVKGEMATEAIYKIWEKGFAR